MRRSLFATTLAASLALGGIAANAQQTGTPRHGGTAIVGLAGEPPGLNPAITTNGVITMCWIYEGLVVLNSETGEFEPALAESWSISDDGKVYTFKLRETTWHDGTQFTAEDVRYSIADVGAKIGPNLSGVVGSLLEEVVAVDDHTVEIRLKEPYGPLMSMLTCAFSGAIIPSHLYKDTDPATNPVTQSPVGTGPFKFDSWAPGSHIRLARNADYWDEEKPYLDGVVVQFMPSAGSRTQALFAGELDFVPVIAIPASDSARVEATPGFKRERSGLPAGQLFAFLNLEDDVLKDVAVRHALLTAIDRDYIFENAFHGLGAPGRAPWTGMFDWAHDPAVDYDTDHAYDPARAARLLDEAGYPADASGTRFTLDIVYDANVSERGVVAEALKAMWGSVGVMVTLTPLELSITASRVFEQKDFDVFVMGYTAGADPEVGVARAFITSRIGKNNGNASGYSNPEVDALFQEAARGATFAERGAVYRQIEPILMRDMPSYMLHDMRGFDAANEKLMGAWGYVGHVRMGNAWFAE